MCEPENKVFAVLINTTTVPRILLENLGISNWRK
jgi:hypothetical protein